MCITAELESANPDFRHSPTSLARLEEQHRKELDEFRKNNPEIDEETFTAEIRRQSRDPQLILILAAYGKPNPVDLPVIVPTLLQALQDESYDMRALAADGLGNIGRGSADVLPALEAALHDVHWLVRLHAARAIAIGLGRADLALPTLRAGLKCHIRHVPDLAALYLGQIGAAAVPAVPDLIEALRHHDEMSARKQCLPWAASVRRCSSVTGTIRLEAQQSRPCAKLSKTPQMRLRSLSM
jgi:hypothetical protein